MTKVTETEIISALGGETAVHSRLLTCPSCGSLGFGGFLGSYIDGRGSPGGTYQCRGCGLFWTRAELNAT